MPVGPPTAHTSQSALPGTARQDPPGVFEAPARPGSRAERLVPPRCVDGRNSVGGSAAVPPVPSGASELELDPLQ